MWNVQCVKLVVNVLFGLILVLQLEKGDGIMEDTTEILSERMLSLVVCSTITDEDRLTRLVNNISPCGTSLGWVISDRTDKVLQCDEYPDRKHWLFVC